MQTRPTRSALYIPGSKPRALDKARGLTCDVILFDLEDAVAPDAKIEARSTLHDALAQGGYGGRLKLVRINGLDTDWGADDARAAAKMPCDGVLVPKVSSPADLDAVADLVPDLPLWAMMETPLGILNAQTIAAHPRLEGFVIGTNDLAKDMGSRTRAALTTALQHCLLAARAAGIVAIDGVYNAYQDQDGLQRECIEGRDMGFDGKSLIHPAQLDTANAVFGPTAEDIDLAHRQIAAFDAAVAEGQGVAVLDGRIVENLHIVTARATLAKADAIAALERT
ncbi:MAG: (3S)-malyl-CoA thioesterase [Loktanella salsilacus]|jgi:(3S)-malyl-CoA thioesterase|uniref:HpcH/HpaI aldolase/citrate lyase family protein n=1 Tax=Loktanella salsilacus TaxID=195913 RepID=UPI0020B78E61|nr:CoA ester lyase [Loktanella salsilacus]MBU0780399.1 CoA ester lyase [Alphaproteobacteria bacterium]UTH44783.1 CoA ester lyase [Loktanella salsilacus]